MNTHPRNHPALAPIIKTTLFLFLALLPTAKSFATAQYPDILIYEGKEFSLHTNPLEELFSKNEDKRPKGDVTSTALWRGYVAKFEIKDGWLFAKEVNVKIVLDREAREYERKYGWKNVIADVFKTEKDKRLDWFSGLLILPHGALINYVHMGYASTYENYILLEIDKGKLVKEKKLFGEAYSIFKKKQFELFKKTDEYKKQVKELTKDGRKPEDVERFLEIFVIEYSKRILTESD